MTVHTPFQHPTTVLLAGPTMCGKTHFLLQMLARHALQPPPQRIILVYGEWQPAYDHLQNMVYEGTLPQVEFVKNFDDALYQTINPDTRNLVIVDDQMENSGVHRSSKKQQGGHLTQYFTQGAHHRNLTVIYIVQNLFHQDPSMRTISLNSHYIVAFKIPRDKTQIRTLGCQMFPSNATFLLDVYDDATDVPYGYLLMDLRPNTPDLIRIRTDVLEETSPTIYVEAHRVAAALAHRVVHQRSPVKSPRSRQPPLKSQRRPPAAGRR